MSFSITTKVQLVQVALGSRFLRSQSLATYLSSALLNQDLTVLNAA